MKKIALLLALIVSASAFIGCTSVAPVCATSNELGEKVGTNTAGYLFGIIPITGTQITVLLMRQKRLELQKFQQLT